MRRMLVLAVASVLLVACATDDDAGANRVVDEAREPASGDTAPSDGETAAQAPTATEGATGSVDDTAGATSGTDGDVVTDLTVARPGSWPVGDAGTVTFAVAEGRAVLEDHQAAEGFQSAVTEEDDDDIQVDFRRDDARWEFEVETDDGRLEIDIRQDHHNADPGTYEMEAGSFTFSRSGDTLTMDSIDLGDGWQLSEREDDDDSLEFEARAGDRTVEVEVELDDGRIDVEIDYTVTGPLDS